MSIRNKSFLAFGLIFLLVFVMGFFQYINSNSQLKDIKRIENQTLQSSIVADELKLSVVQVQQFLSDISATRAQDGYDDGFQKAEQYSQQFYKDLEQLMQLNPADKSQLEEIKVSFEAYYTTGKEMANAYIKKGPVEGNKLMPNFDEAAQDINSKVNQLQQNYIKAINGSLKNMESSIESNLTMFVLLGAIVIGIGIVVAVLLSRAILKPLSKLIRSSEQIAQGNLSESALISSKDEFGKLSQAFEEMRLNLNGLITQVDATAKQIVSSSEELTASTEATTEATDQIMNAIQDVASGTENQSSTLLKTSRSISEISQGMNQASTTIENVSFLGVQAEDRTKSGNKVVQETLEQMEYISQKVNQTAIVVDHLGITSKEIGQIISIITQIADQTNLLALNAAIESARAGEHGKGFAVVADEVRLLAEQSSQSASKIQQLIEQIQKETQTAISSMNEGKNAVTDGIDLTSRTGESFKEIAKLIQQITEKTVDVSAVVEQVNASTDNMVDMMNQIASISEQTSGNAQNVYAAAEEQNVSMHAVAKSSEKLNQVAVELQTSVQRFKLCENEIMKK